jgi:hypothetical protein
MHSPCDLITKFPILKDIIIILIQLKKVEKSIVLLVFIILLIHLAVGFDHGDNNRQSFASPAVMINEVELNPHGADCGEEKSSSIIHMIALQI